MVLNLGYTLGSSGEILKVLILRSPCRAVNSESPGSGTQTTVMCLSDLGLSSVQPGRELMILSKIPPLGHLVQMQILIQ